MVYSRRDTCSGAGSYTVASGSYEPADSVMAVAAAAASRTLTAVDETLVHDWQISGPANGERDSCSSDDDKPQHHQQHPHSTGSTLTRPISAWSATESGSETATEEFTVNQHRDQLHQQEKQPHEHQEHQEPQEQAKRPRKKGSRRINFLKYILSFTIFRRWKAVHKAEECPSPGGFAMVLQNASCAASSLAIANHQHHQHRKQATGTTSYTRASVYIAQKGEQQQEQ
uniref:Uncharacterized protein n=1 Tax=Anopheles albimanus TaxID=7167 RepID=A0A182F297_ANOAL